MTESTRIPNDPIGAAGVFHVASELSLRGFIALPTVGNCEGWDLIVAGRERRDVIARVQVKTSSKKHPRFWPMPKPEKIKHGKNDYYVLLRRGRDGNAPFDCYLVTGTEARRRVEVTCKEQTRNGKKLFPCIWFLPDKGRQWQKHWARWKPGR